MKYFKAFNIYLSLLVIMFVACDEKDDETSETMIPVSSITVNAETSKIAIGETTQFTTTIRPVDSSNKEINWSTSDETIATVDDNGLVTGVAAGEVSIIAVSADDETIEDSFSLMIIGTDTNEIVSFDLQGITGTIVDNNITIELVVGTDVSYLAPEISHTGTTISPNNLAPQDFTNPVTYLVVAENGDTQEYTVNVTYTDNTPTGSEFITTWSGTEITIPVDNNFSYNYNIDTDNDGVIDISGIKSSYTIQFSTPGPHTIRISGTFPALTFSGYTSSADDLLEVNQWGTNEWISMRYGFAFCEDLAFLATDVPNFSKLVSMGSMFAEAENITGLEDTSGWNLSNVKDMSRMFQYCNFTIDTSTWDTSSVTNMSGMFIESGITIDTSNWDTSSVTNLSGMFELSSANIDTSNWDTSSVTNMSNMFFDSSMDIDTSNWDTSSVTNMSGMFEIASVRIDMSNWDTSSVTNMSGMFYDASGTPDTSNWDTSSVTNMSGMFEECSINPDTSNWDTSSVTSMSGMFQYNPRANPDTSNWDTSSVTTMNSMFEEAGDADPDTSNWDTSNVTNMSYMFYAAVSASPDVRNWDIGNVTTMRSMFEGAELDTDDYDNLLINFASQPRQDDIDFHGGTSTYCTAAASSARAVLISATNWTITDDGNICI